MLFTALLLLILNVYPVLVTRDTVIDAKRSSMQSQGLVISSSLSALDSLSGESVSLVMELLDVAPMTRMIVTDPAGLILYDASDDADAVGRYALLSEIRTALEGRSVFTCSYTGGEFVSRCAVPVVSGGSTLGAVYLFERDAEQGEIIRGLQRNLSTMSIAFGGVGLVVILFISTTLTLRIKRLASAVGVVSSGDYAYRLKVRGNDEIAELSDEFNELTDRLERTEEARRRFVSDASHELRTPLEAERLQRITEKLMSLTKLDAGVTRRQREPVDMKQVAQRALHLLEPLAAAESVTLVPELDDGCVVSASADDLYQIIFNLAENGVKYNVPGGTVTLSLRRDAGSAVLNVLDTGIGIPEADLGSIFDRFYRVDKARSRASGGSGLGLAIVHDAVLANDGSIEVARREEGGTRFTVTFPLIRGRKEKPS